MLPKATGNAEHFTKKTFRYQIMSRCQIPNPHIQNIPVKEMSSSTEAFACITYENCKRKWEAVHEWNLRPENANF